MPIQASITQAAVEALQSSTFVSFAESLSEDLALNPLTVLDVGTLCLPGRFFEDWRCRLCPPGTHKPGSLPDDKACMLCPDATFAAQAGSTVCAECAAGTTRDEDGQACSAHINGSCFAAQLSLDSQCAVRVLQVRGCAAEEGDFVAAMEGEDGSRGWNSARGEDGTPLAQVAATCASFYQWVCPHLGAEAGVNIECDFYCDFWGAMAEQLASDCSDDAQCQHQPRSTFQLQPASPALCYADALSSLVSSCEVPQGGMGAFMAAVEQLLSLSHSPEACETGVHERMRVTHVGRAPQNLADLACFDVTDCRVACMTNDFMLVRGGALHFSAQSLYVGECNCNETGVFEGAVQLWPEVSHVAQDAVDDTMVVSPVPAFNQFAVHVHFEDMACMYAWNIGAGSLLGMPTAHGRQPQYALLDFVAFDPELSTASSANPTASSANPARRLLQAGQETRAGGCPTEDSDCLYQCLTSGFAHDTYGDTVMLIATYDGGFCDCSNFFLQKMSDGRPALIGKVLGDLEVGNVAYIFERSVLMKADSEPDELGQSLLRDARLQPFVNNMLLLNVGGCVYKYNPASGGVFGILAPVEEEEAVANETAPEQNQTEVLQVSKVIATLTPDESQNMSALPEACQSLQGDCRFDCILSGQTRVVGTGDALLGQPSGGSDCECSPQTGVLHDSRLQGDAWMMIAGQEEGQLLFVFASDSADQCVRSMRVLNGTFLGVAPAGPPPQYWGPVVVDEGEAENETSFWDTTVDVEEAKQVAETLTTAINTGLALSLAGAVTSAITGAIAGAAGAAAGGAAAGAATSSGQGGGGCTPFGATPMMTMISQTQFLALASRIGGPNGAQNTEATAALSGGMGWSNGHVLSLYDKGFNYTEEYSKVLEAEEGGRRAGKGRGSGDFEDGGLEGEALFYFACERVKESPRELFSTMI
eukprot:3267724-Rhodomonas_salina.1